jgi:hypothetical protein
VSTIGEQFQDTSANRVAKNVEGVHHVSGSGDASPA